MNTKQLFFGMLLAGAAFTGNAQNNVDSSTLTSGGVNAGVAGSNSVYFGVDAGGSTTNGGKRNNTFIGHSAGKSNITGSSNTYIGYAAGIDGISGINNTFIGNASGPNNTTSNNTFIGSGSGRSTTSGDSNNFFGYNAGESNDTGRENIYFGFQSGATGEKCSYNVYVGNSTGFANTNMYGQNVFVGHAAGANNADGSGNVFLGSNTGINNNGSNNVFIGKQAGSLNTTASNTLYIENSDAATPLIWGDFANDLVKLNAKVGVGGVTSFPTTAGAVDVSGYNLFVKGGILTEEVRVNLSSSWADYVFAGDYNLKPLEEVECFIAENGHLPNVPSAKQVAEEGVALGDMARIQQEKIEELTLYAIQQQKQLEKQDAEIKELKAMVKVLLENK